MRFEMIVIGASAGGITAFAELLPIFPTGYPIPIAIVQHLHPLQDRYHVEHFSNLCSLKVKEADDKEPIRAGWIYFAPPNYHLYIEDERIFSLSIDAKVNYSRPSIDVLFESAGDVYRHRLVGVVLTGANNDGAHGLCVIKQKGGMTIVQDPKTAESPYMPEAASKATKVDYILPLQEIGKFLLDIQNQS